MQPTERADPDTEALGQAPRCPCSHWRRSWDRHWDLQGCWSWRLEEFKLAEEDWWWIEMI